eukprot:scaffold3505_cov60-Phaeocystis_antarctica.AAC.3
MWPSPVACVAVRRMQVPRTGSPQRGTCRHARAPRGHRPPGVARTRSRPRGNQAGAQAAASRLSSPPLATRGRKDLGSPPGPEVQSTSRLRAHQWGLVTRAAPSRGPAGALARSIARAPPEGKWPRGEPTAARRSGKLVRRERCVQYQQGKVEGDHDAHNVKDTVFGAVVGPIAREELDEGAAEEDAHQRGLRGDGERVEAITRVRLDELDER